MEETGDPTILIHDRMNSLHSSLLSTQYYLRELFYSLGALSVTKQS